MAIKDIFKVSRKTFVDPSGWLGLSSLKRNTHATWQAVSSLFNVPEATVTPEAAETFDAALQRYNLTPAAVKEIEKDYLFYAGLFLALAAFSFLVGFYFLFVERTIIGFILSLAVVMLFGSQAFRYHFWYFQIKQRKLGCTFEEWKQAFFPHKESPGP